MVAITRLILLASTVAAATLQLLPRDVITVQNDITKKIGPELQTLSTHINAFPGSGRAGAETIVKDATALIETVTNATTHVKEAGNFGVVSGTAVLAQIQLAVPLILGILSNIRAKASAWDAIEGPKLAEDDLKAGKVAFSNYFDAIIAAEPFIQKSGGVSVKTTVIGAFDQTIAAFSKS